MGQRSLLSIACLCLLSSCSRNLVFAQTAEPATAALKALHVEGVKHLSVPQVVTLSGLSLGSAVGKKDLQAAAYRLVQTGLFANVNYVFQTREDGLYLTFKLDEAARIPAYFDNLPWFTDAELADAVRKVLPFYDGTLPEAGAT